MRLSRLARIPENWPPALVVVGGLVLMGLVGAADYFTGAELSFSVLYLLPVAVVAWYASRWAGYAICTASVLVAFWANAAAGQTYSHWLMAVDDSLVLLAFFLIAASLLVALKAHLTHDRFLARTDNLTQLLNAQGFEEISERLVRLASRHHHPLVFASIDLVGLRAVTGAQGQPAGDAALQAIARALRGCTRASDVVGRLSGDRITVLMPETSRHGAEVAMAKIHKTLSRETEEQGWPVGLCIGVALYPRAPLSVDDGVEVAERLANQVKEQGTSGVLYEEQPAGPSRRGDKQPYLQPGASEHRVLRALSRR
jgi:diguanylate cyclase (GGDEF)-like protein